MFGWICGVSNCVADLLKHACLICIRHKFAVSNIICCASDCYILTMTKMWTISQVSLCIPVVCIPDIIHKLDSLQCVRLLCIWPCSRLTRLKHAWHAWRTFAQVSKDKTRSLQLAMWVFTKPHKHNVWWKHLSICK